MRSVFPQELPLLLALGGLRVVERFGDWSRTPLTGNAALRLYVCTAAEPNAAGLPVQVEPDDLS